MRCLKAFKRSFFNCATRTSFIWKPKEHITLRYQERYEKNEEHLDRTKREGTEQSIYIYIYLFRDVIIHTLKTHLRRSNAFAQKKDISVNQQNNLEIFDQSSQYLLNVLTDFMDPGCD